MKDCLLALWDEIKKQWFWLALAVFIAIMLCCLGVQGSQLSDYLEKNNLRLPPNLEERLDKMGLVAAYGMKTEDLTFHETFAVSYVRKEDADKIEQDIGVIDPSLVVVKIRYYPCKKKIAVEYTTYDRKIWGFVEYGKKQVVMELFDL